MKNNEKQKIENRKKHKMKHEKKDGEKLRNENEKAKYVKCKFKTKKEK